MARTGLLVAVLLVLAGVVQPAGSPPGPRTGTSPHASSISLSNGSAWQDTQHVLRDQPRRLVAARHTPTTSDTAWVVPAPAADGSPPVRRAPAGAAGDAGRGCAAPPHWSSRAPPADVS